MHENVLWERLGACFQERGAGADDPAASGELAAYGATIRDRGAGSTKVWAGRSRTMSRELELVAGRLCDLPGCAASANP